MISITSMSPIIENYQSTDLTVPPRWPENNCVSPKKRGWETSWSLGGQIFFYLLCLYQISEAELLFFNYQITSIKQGAP